MSSWLTLWLVGCQGCSCGAGLPPDQTDDTADSFGDTAETDTPEDTFVDTAPPPPCAFPEIEPNGSQNQATPMVLEQWGCGAFVDGVDPDWFQVDLDREAWFRVNVDAQTIGSPADVYLTMASDSGERLAIDRDVETNDPFVVFPVSLAETWYILLTDEYSGDGEEYTYKMMPSITKAPMEWDRLETEEELVDDTGFDAWRDDFDTAMAISSGEKIFGRVGHSDDIDWFSLTIPPAKHEVTITVTAHALGSPLDSRIVLFDAYEERIDISVGGVSAYDRDPILDATSDGDEVWYISVKGDTGNTGEGSAYWYVLEVDLSLGL